MSASNKLIQAAAGVGGEAEDTDPDFANAVLLLNGDDAPNGGQNNTFLDSSSNAHTITRNGNATQGSFSPFSVDDGKWGNYFDGTGDYLSVASDASFGFGTGDFTMECWIYPNSVPTGYLGILSTLANDVIVGVALSTDSAGRISFSINGATGGVFTGNSTLTKYVANAWQHIALTRESGTVRVWLDGTQIGTDKTDTGDCGASDNAVVARIYTNVDNYYFDGYISNARIIKGTALYTSAFTPPTTPLTDITNTSLLTCQSNRFVDNSSNAHSITVGGAPKVVPFSPFPQTTVYDASTNGGSGYFEDGDTDVLSIPDSTDFDIYDGDYTVTAWIYPTSFNTFNYFLSKGHSSTREWAFTVTSSNIRAYWSTDGAGSGDQFVTASTTNNLNEWMHLAFVKSGSTITIYKNGVSIGSGSFTSIYSGSDPLYISRFMDFTGIAHSHDGYISNLRIVKGTAIAPSGIPTAPVTDVTNTSLLTNFTNASIKDATGKNVLETVGNAQVDTTTKKYGTGAMEFDGTGDYLSVASSPLFYFGTGDFTVECWINTTVKSTDAGDRRIFKLDGPSSSAADQIQLLIDATSGVIKFFSNSDILTGTTAVDDGSWHHVALVRDSGTSTLFIDGSSEDSAADTTDYDVSTTPSPNIGSFNGTAGDWDGYIDDFRITKGIARYTANFTPPTAALPVIG